jgi:hypothetical protein
MPLKRMFLPVTAHSGGQGLFLATTAPPPGTYRAMVPGLWRVSGIREGKWALRSYKRPQSTSPASPRHAHLGPMALPKGNQQPDLKPLPLLRSWKKTPEQINTMRRSHEDPCSPRPLAPRPPRNLTCLTSTRAPRPHGTPQEQPAARLEAFAPPEALEKDTRAK